MSNVRTQSIEPVGISRRDGKRPDGMTQIPWRSGKLLIWDVTVIVSTPAQFYVATTAPEMDNHFDM